MSNLSKFLLFVGVMLCIILDSCAATGYETRKSALQQQEMVFDHCTKGISDLGEDAKQASYRECMAKSSHRLLAPALSIFAPIEYDLRKPRLEEATEVVGRNGEAFFHRKLTARVSKTFPVGKRIVFVSRIHAIERDGVCFFLNSKGKVESIGQHCGIGKTHRWYSGQAGFDGRSRERAGIEETVSSVNQDLTILVTHDWLGSIFNPPR